MLHVVLQVYPFDSMQKAKSPVPLAFSFGITLPVPLGNHDTKIHKLECVMWQSIQNQVPAVQPALALALCALIGPQELFPEQTCLLLLVVMGPEVKGSQNTSLRQDEQLTGHLAEQGVAPAHQQQPVDLAKHTVLGIASPQG